MTNSRAMKRAAAVLTGLFAAVLYVSLTVSVQTQAQGKGGGGGSSTGCGGNVTSILNDYEVINSNSVPFQIQSDGQGSYTTYSNSHKDSVSSIIRSDCSWSLDTTGSVLRGISVTLAYPYNGAPPAPFTGTQLVKGVINSHCYSNPTNGGIDFGSMTSAGQTLICPINLGFYFNRVWYNIAINPYNWPGTSQTQVTCTGASGGACNQWTVVPDTATGVINSTTGQSSAIGELILPDCVGCVAGTPIGLYEVSFSFLIHK